MKNSFWLTTAVLKMPVMFLEKKKDLKKLEITIAIKELKFIKSHI